MGPAQQGTTHLPTTGVAEGWYYRKGFLTLLTRAGQRAWVILIVALAQGKGRTNPAQKLPTTAPRPSDLSISLFSIWWIQLS